MPTYKHTLSYDGTDFAGWQKQEPPARVRSSNGPPVGASIDPRKLDPDLVAGKPGRIALRTVQAVLERAVRQVVREPVFVQGASRTDAGVHAHAQVAAFTCSEQGWPLDRGLDRLVRAINARLPNDVLVRAVEPVDASFNPIGDCLSKGYVYTMYASRHRPLWSKKRVYHTWADLDLQAMQHAASALRGEHDFASMAAANHGRQSTVRTIYTCEIVDISKSFLAQEHFAAAGDHTNPNTPAPDLPVLNPRCAAYSIDESNPRVYRLSVAGNGFLYNMVRILAGTLHEVGRGRLKADSIPDILTSCDRRRAGPTLPPEGLCLAWIAYGNI